MKKKLFVSLAVLTLIVGMVACGKEGPGESDGGNSSIELTGGTKEGKGNEELIEITIPSDLTNGVTQEELDKESKEKGYNSAKLNEDGSVTYTMTNAQHKEMLKDLGEELIKSLNEMVGSETYPNITKIEANEDFTEFTITTKSTQLDMAESFSTIAFYMYGGMYGVFSGKEVENIHLTFKNEKSGNVIQEFDSKDSDAEGSAGKVGKEENTDKNRLPEIKKWYIGSIWNNFIDFNAFRETGKDCTGKEIDINFAYENFKEEYKKKDEYNQYILSLSEDYSDLKSVWEKMNEQIETIYKDLEENGIKEGTEGLDTDLLSQYSEKFYEYAK